MNILILSCGTRYTLVDYFRKCELFERVICTDISLQAPALFAADAYYLVPAMKDPRYLETIMEICKKEDITMVLPLHEDELILLSRESEMFRKNGIIPVISDYSAVALCRDKYLFSRTMIDKGIPAVMTYTAEEYMKAGEEFESFFVKPRYGAGSVNTFEMRSKKLLGALMEEYQEEFIVQPKVCGKEYGIDLYVDLISGEAVGCFCKQKLRMRAGETEKSISVCIPELQRLATDAVKVLGLKGPLDMDVLEQDGQYYILEINPRFGGGYPHAYLCGVNFVVFLAKNGLGQANLPGLGQYEEGILALKYSSAIIKDTKEAAGL